MELASGMMFSEYTQGLLLDGGIPGDFFKVYFLIHIFFALPELLLYIKSNVF